MAQADLTKLVSIDWSASELATAFQQQNFRDLVSKFDSLEQGARARALVATALLPETARIELQGDLQVCRLDKRGSCCTTGRLMPALCYKHPSRCSCSESSAVTASLQLHDLTSRPCNVREHHVWFSHAHQARPWR